MAQDDQLKASLERTLTSLRSQLDGNVRAAAEEIVRALTIDRDRAVAQATAEVRRQAQEQLGQLRAATRKQNEDVRASADTQIADLRRMLDDLRRDAQQQIDNAHKTLGTEVAAARAKAATEVEEARRVARQEIAEIQRTLSERVGRLEGDLEISGAEAGAARQQADEARQQAAEARQQAAEARQQAAEARQQVAYARREAHEARVQAEEEARRVASARAAEPNPVSDVVEATRALDQAVTLADVFEHLLEAAGRFAERTRLLLVHGERLETWRASGFDLPLLDGALDVDTGLTGAAIRERRPVTRTGGEGPDLPLFAAGDERDAIALPVTVAGVVVAVLYADAPGAGAPGGVAWTSSLEVVTRHASRVLETTTVQQAASLLASAPPARPSPTSPGHQRPGSLP